MCIRDSLNYLLDKEDDKGQRERSKDIILSNVEEDDLLVSDGGDPIRKLINKTLLGNSTLKMKSQLKRCSSTGFAGLLRQFSDQNRHFHFIAAQSIS